MIKKNTNISLFTQKDHKISNKTSWHNQTALGTLLSCIAGPEIFKYMLLRGDDVHSG